MNFKKPNFWDLNKPNLLSYLLFPFTLLIQLNNFFLNFSKGYKLAKIKTICIGNIYIGGTGKTPTAIKIYNLLNKLGYKIVTAKKYYKTHNDEQIILKKKTEFITASNRKEIIKKTSKMNKDIIIFDDGLQDKSIDYDLKFVCFDSECWIGNGQLIPSGPLREKLNSLKKYDAIFLKKNNNNLDEIIEIIRRFNPSIKIFITEYIVSNLDKFDLSNKYLFFSGIGNPNSFKNSLIKENFLIVDEIIYPDHYDYSEKELNEILEKSKKLNTKIITTEKDFVKIPKKYHDNIEYLEVELNIKEQNELTKFLKFKLNEKY